MTRPCNVPPVFLVQQPFRPPFFFLQGIEYTPIIVIISFPYLQNNTVSVQSKPNKNFKSLKAQHGVQMISDPDCRKPPDLFSATPQSPWRGGEDVGQYSTPILRSTVPFSATPPLSDSDSQQPPYRLPVDRPDHPPAPSQPQETETASSAAGIANRNTERTQ